MNSGKDIRPLVSRLREIQRRCSSMGTRNEEFPQMAERLGLIISRLEKGEEESGEPLEYKEIARGLFPVAHLFESFGFTSVGKEIAHIERALQEFAPVSTEPSSQSTPPPPSQDASPASIATHSAARSISDTSTVVRDESDVAQSSSSLFPRPVAISLLVLVICVLAVFTLVITREPVRRDLPPEPVAIEIAPTPTPAPIPTPTPISIVDGSNPRALLAVEVGKARLALDAGNIDDAVESLSAAALLDVDDITVIDVAERIMIALIEHSDNAAGQGQWDVAEKRLDRARRIAMRFGFPTESIETAEWNHASMDRFQRLQPNDKTAIRAAAGKRVIVFFLNEPAKEGQIKGIDGRNLLLDIDSSIGRGGSLKYTEEIALVTISEIRVYDD